MAFDITKATLTLCFERNGDHVRPLPWGFLQAGEGEPVYITTLPIYGMGTMTPANVTSKPYRIKIEYMPDRPFPLKSAAGSRLAGQAATQELHYFTSY